MVHDQILSHCSLHHEPMHSLITLIVLSLLQIALVMYPMLSIYEHLLLDSIPSQSVIISI